MKRKFFECAILLGIVMSVMFLAQTPDGIGHDDPYDPNDENSPPPHKPVGHTHRPSIRVDAGTGNPVSTGGVDPRKQHFSGRCGETGDRVQSAWGFRYGGGTFAPSPTGNPDDDTQNVWSLHVNVEASTEINSARVVVTPGIYLTHFHRNTGSWQGTGSGTVKFSGVCYHSRVLWKCLEHSIEGDFWKESGFIDIKVSKASISKGIKKTYGMGFESHGAKLTSESVNTYTTSYDDLYARGYKFTLELKGNQYGYMPHYQTKWARGSGQLMLEHVKSDTARAKYKFDDWLRCYCGDSKTPDSEHEH